MLARMPRGVLWGLAGDAVAVLLGWIVCAVALVLPDSSVHWPASVASLLLSLVSSNTAVSAAFGRVWFRRTHVDPVFVSRSVFWATVLIWGGIILVSLVLLLAAQSHVSSDAARESVAIGALSLVIALSLPGVALFRLMRSDRGTV
jgi:hypothetical protein